MIKGGGKGLEVSNGMFILTPHGRAVLAYLSVGLFFIPLCKSVLCTALRLLSHLLPVPGIEHLMIGLIIIVNKILALEKKEKQTCLLE